MSDFRRWGFEEDDAEPFVSYAQAPKQEQPTANHGDHITGHDADGVVTVAVTDDADVVAVKLTSGWRSSLDARALHSSVLAAMNAATISAMAARAERLDEMDPDSTGTAEVPPSSQPAEDRPVTAEDAMRLIDAVTADLGRFMQQVSAATDQVVTAESSGGHVLVTGRQRQATDVAIDPRWVVGARDSEIESELVDALASFTNKSSLGDLTQGPQSTNIDELRRLVRDPQTLIRRISERNS
ncbi:MAG: hypothetical protein GEU97_01925 [Actinophytocola sp.]|nr:hypothetical protein [Actinophytocola sp.]